MRRFKHRERCYYCLRHALSAERPRCDAGIRLAASTEQNLVSEDVVAYGSGAFPATPMLIIRLWFRIGGRVTFSSIPASLLRYQPQSKMQSKNATTSPSKALQRTGDMTRIALITLLCLALNGYAQRSVSVASNQQSVEEMEAETQRAFELERRADLVIDYERLDRIRLRTSARTEPISATDETLAAAIASISSKRELAVIIIGKPVQYEFPDPQLRKKVDSIEAVVRARGFTRIVFQLASAEGRSIYRE